MSEYPAPSHQMSGGTSTRGLVLRQIEACAFCGLSMATLLVDVPVSNSAVRISQETVIVQQLAEWERIWNCVEIYDLVLASKIVV